MSSVTLNLLVGGDGAKNDFRELSTVEGTICDTPIKVSTTMESKSVALPYNLQGLLDNGHRQMSPIVHKPGDVILGHFGELFLKDTFQTSKND